IARLRQSIDELVEGRAGAVEGVSREILETYRMFAHDTSWFDRLVEGARLGLSAEGAVERVRNEQRARMLSARDPYLRERLHDLEDLANRLLRHLADEDHALVDGAAHTPEDAILFARAIGPAELLELPLDRLKGVVLEEGSPTSHAAIVARALGVPMVGRIEAVLDRVEDGDFVILDGGAGEVHLRPTPDAMVNHDERVAQRGARAALYESVRDAPAVTRDGVRIELMINAGLSIDLPQLDRTGADGIGLYRTEFQFMIAERMPRLGEQRDLYTEVLDVAGDRPVTFRTLDLGGDKLLPYLAFDREENPAMGWRALRLALDRPGLLRFQLRALVGAAAGRELRVMFPMVTTVAEFIEARDRLDAEIDWAIRHDRGAPKTVKVGAMIETPALVYQLDALLDEADFVSVGANDLMQFFFAVDRANPRLVGRYDLLSPPGLRILREIADGCAAAGAEVTVCGEVAGRPLEALALIGLGFRRLSMPAVGIGPVKQLVLNAEQKKIAEAVDVLTTSRKTSVREDLANFAAETGLAW
ncbi:MAG: phosphoenolpyruvate--protein phosphotransferase, partial [Maricaulaceae bacterium]